MPDPVQNFWEQYKENVEVARSLWPQRLLRVVVIMGGVAILAPCCMAVANVTGSKVAAGVIGFAGAIGVLLVWLVILRLFFSPAEPALPPQQPWTSHTSNVTPISEPVASQVEPKTTGGGCFAALAGIFAVLCLSCCGGGIVVAKILYATKAPEANQRPDFPQPVPFEPITHLPPTEPVAVPPQSFPSFNDDPLTSPGVPVVEQNDPFERMRKQQAEQMEAMRQRHEEMMRRHEEIRQRHQEMLRRGGVFD